MRDHYVILGFGSTGASAAADLVRRGVEPDRIVAVDIDASAVAGAANQGFVAIQGNATNSAVLDQAAVRVHLRPGKNRLVVEVTQKNNAWRFMLRVTDPRGNLVPARTVPAPWGGPPEPAT